MKVLHIYKLEDLKQTQAVAKLPIGEHPIGRGGILNCTDRRVSHSHAIIIVSEEKIILKSVHINPCFYKAAKENIIVLVRKNESVSLSDGDQFALLADSDWFKIKVVSDESSIDSPEEQNQGEKCGKVCNTNKTSEVSTPSGSCLNVSKLLKASLEADETKIDTHQLMNNLENIFQEDFGHIKNISDKNEESDESMDFADLLTKDTGNSRDNEELAPAVNEEETIPVQTDTPKKDEIKAEVADTSKESVASEKDSPEKDLGTVKNQDDDKSNTGEEAADMNGASTSTDKPKTRRERCWYGATCYRKNPVHRTALSHPGDNDYESDPNDDRPVCPYGASCYRTNVDHRRVYKHSAPPSVKKPAGDGQPKRLPKKEEESVSGSDKSGEEDTEDIGKTRKRKAAKKVKKLKETPEDEEEEESVSGSDKSCGEDNEDTGKGRKRKAAKKVKNLKETPEDDYDLNDPFLNDGSSDDFEPSEDDTDDTTDWEDSQCVDEESQERKRLLKEAKKFTKTKKRKKT